MIHGNRKQEIQETLDKYGSELTIHGLSKVYGGKKLTERLFWLVCLLGTLAALIFVLRNLCEKYLAYHSYTNITVMPMTKLLLPRVTVCSSVLYRINKWSYKGQYFEVDDSISFSENIKWEKYSCVYPENQLLFSIDCTEYYDGKTLFNNTCTEFDTATYQYVQGPRHIMTYAFKLDISNYVDDLYFVYLDFGDKNISLDGIGDLQEVQKGKHYSVVVETKEISRLKSPYQSNCSDDPEKMHNILPGYYTTRACQLSCSLKQKFMDCGAVSDIFARHIPKDFAELH